MIFYCNPPTTCDICHKPITDTFVDGRVVGGTAWANMCEHCHKRNGTGLGSGKGQLYKKNATGQFVKIEG